MKVYATERGVCWRRGWSTQARAMRRRTTCPCTGWRRPALLSTSKSPGPRTARRSRAPRKHQSARLRTPRFVVNVGSQRCRRTRRIGTRSNGVATVFPEDPCSPWRCFSVFVDSEILEESVSEISTRRCVHLSLAPLHEDRCLVHVPSTTVPWPGVRPRRRAGRRCDPSEETRRADSSAWCEQALDDRRLQAERVHELVQRVNEIVLLA